MAKLKRIYPYLGLVIVILMCFISLNKSAISFLETKMGFSLLICSIAGMGFLSYRLNVRN